MFPLIFMTQTRPEIAAVSAAFFVIRFVRHPAFAINAAFRLVFCTAKRGINLFLLTAVEPLVVSQRWGIHQIHCSKGPKLILKCLIESFRLITGLFLTFTELHFRCHFGLFGLLEQNKCILIRFIHMRLLGTDEQTGSNVKKKKPIYQTRVI